MRRRHLTVAGSGSSGTDEALSTSHNLHAEARGPSPNKIYLIARTVTGIQHRESKTDGESDLR